LTCAGGEETLTGCSYESNSHDCSHWEDAGVVCDTRSQTVRLVGGQGQHEGRVEILYNGQWGTVCDDDFGYKDALVVCKSLGYESGHALTDNEFGPGVGDIFLDDLVCQGTEQGLEECPSRGWGVHNCDHTEDAGVQCDINGGGSSSSDHDTGSNNSGNGNAGGTGSWGSDITQPEIDLPVENIGDLDEYLENLFEQLGIDNPLENVNWNSDISNDFEVDEDGNVRVRTRH